LSRSITIIIADNCDTFRKGLYYNLTSNDFQILGAAVNGIELIQLVKQHPPDIVIIDIRMPVMDGITACRELQQLYPHIGKIALTMYDYYHPDVQEILKAGANGFLTKDADIAEIKRCIETVHNGSSYYNSSCKPVVDAMMKGQTGSHGLIDEEVRLLQLIGEELSSKKIAKRLHKSIHTIGTWRQELLVKCGAKNVAGLVKFGVKWGIIKV
jgi:DNA-binding NarL/FixJ family response regulator